MKITTKSLIVGIMFTASFWLVDFSFASNIFFGSVTDKVMVGDIFEVDLLVDTENQDINAIEGEIVLPNNLSLKEIRDGSSIISFWLERPSLKNDRVSFSGIIPGGYSGRKGHVLTLSLLSVNEGVATIQSQGLKILLNDGRGTLSAVDKSDLSLMTIPKKIIGEVGVITEKRAESISKNDSVLPELFTPKVISTANVFDGQYFLVFGTQDKGSGIDHYEVCETGEKSCLTVDSPYLLENQKLSSPIIVKAVDKNQNVRIVTINNINFGSWFNYVLFFGILLLVLVLFIIYKIKRHAKL